MQRCFPASSYKPHPNHLEGSKINVSLIYKPYIISPEIVWLLFTILSTSAPFLQQQNCIKTGHRAVKGSSWVPCFHTFLLSQKEKGLNFTPPTGDSGVSICVYELAWFNTLFKKPAVSAQQNKTEYSPRSITCGLPLCPWKQLGRNCLNL